MTVKLRMWSRALARPSPPNFCERARQRAKILRVFSWARGARAHNFENIIFENIFAVFIHELIHLMFNVTVIGVWPSSPKSFTSTVCSFPYCNWEVIAHLKIHFSFSRLTLKNDQDLHTTKKLCIFWNKFVIVFDIFNMNYEHSFIERAPRISSVS